MEGGEDPGNRAAAAELKPGDGEGEAGLAVRGGARAKGGLEDGEGDREEDGGREIMAWFWEGEGEEGGVDREREGARAKREEGVEEFADDAAGECWGEEGEVREGIGIRVRLRGEEVGDSQVVPGFYGGPDGALERGFGAGGDGGEAMALHMAKIIEGPPRRRCRH